MYCILPLPTFAPVNLKTEDIMKIITIDSEVYRALTRKIDRIFDYVKQQAERELTSAPEPAEIWIDNDEAVAILEVSKRTLQRLRSKGRSPTRSVGDGRATRWPRYGGLSPDGRSPANTVRRPT